MDDMQLDYGDRPSTGAAASSTAGGKGTAVAERSTTSTFTSTSLKTTGEAPPSSSLIMDKATTSYDVTMGESNTAASRILDELLGDMLSIVEDDDSTSSSEGDEDNETNDSWSTSSSSSSSPSDTEQFTHKDTLKVPTTAAQSDKEEGELESDHELEARRLKEEQKRIQREERAKQREEKKKLSIEENVSERDVYRYLKHRGESLKVLSDSCREREPEGCRTRTRLEARVEGTPA